MQYGRKGSLAFSDLKGLGSFGLSSIGIDNVVGWRNYASAQPTGLLNSNFSFNANSTNTYYNFILSDPTYIQLWNFLTGSSLNYFTNYFLSPNHTNSALGSGQPSLNNNQTDQAFTGRKELINFATATTGGNFTVNALQYLGTLSREAMASVPQWSPATPTATNPNFQTDLLVTLPFTRNDGSTANAGEYLVNQRFLLQRLNWLTYKGPSATVANGGARIAVPTSAPAWPPSANSDYDLWLLTRTNGITFGLTSAFLQDLNKGGTAANILKYFGLVWQDSTNQPDPTQRDRWNYVGHSGGTAPATSIATLGSLTGTREPDFFELLQAGILSGSLADSVPSYSELPIAQQQSSMLHVLTIAANLIAQSRVDSYPVRIACTVGGTVMEAVGAPRLPYINGLAACPVGVTATTGGMNWLLVPNLWDPFRDSWDLTEVNAANNGNGPLLTPGYLRPSVRITLKGTGTGGAFTIGFGTTPPVTNSGRVGSATLLGTAVTVNPVSQPLATGSLTSGGGRDGFLQAMHMGTQDLTASLGANFNTASLGSLTPSWNAVAKPTGDTSTVRNNEIDPFAVFRLSANIPSGTTGSPVLILYSGFQIEMEYLSPNGSWYPYSFLQGNNATNTWISSNLGIATNYSQYFTPTSPVYTAPTICNASAPTLWTTTALAAAPMFAKADPRSIRYNSRIGALTLNPGSAGIIGSIWPSAYTSAPAMPGETNPATYSQTTGDNAPAAGVVGANSNPYGETNGDAVRPVMMNRPFRSVGEMGYAFRDQPFRTLSFSWAPTSPNPDAGLLDLFTTTAYDPTPTPSPTPTAIPAATPTPTPTPRGGVINLNSQQPGAIAGVLTSTIRREDTPKQMGGAPSAPTPSPSPLASPDANTVAASLASSTGTSPILNRAGLATLITNLPDTSGLGPSQPKTHRESVARALGEPGQTRTWNLFIDAIAQSGRFPPNATSLQNGFVVDGEQRYWVHVAIDRFTNEVIAKVIEPVNE
jgi:hypothetical protein